MLEAICVQFTHREPAFPEQDELGSVLTVAVKFQPATMGSAVTTVKLLGNRRFVTAFKSVAFGLHPLSASLLPILVVVVLSWCSYTSAKAQCRGTGQCDLS